MWISITINIYVANTFLDTELVAIFVPQLGPGHHHFTGYYPYPNTNDLE